MPLGDSHIYRLFSFSRRTNSYRKDLLRVEVLRDDFHSHFLLLIQIFSSFIRCRLSFLFWHWSLQQQLCSEVYHSGYLPRSDHRTHLIHLVTRWLKREGDHVWWKDLVGVDEQDSEWTTKPTPWTLRDGTFSVWITRDLLFNCCMSVFLLLFSHLHEYMELLQSVQSEESVMLSYVHNPQSIGHFIFVFFRSVSDDVLYNPKFDHLSSVISPPDVIGGNA